jgi:hypothetical protein
MVESTESESLTEVNAFSDAEIAIRGEIDKVGSGLWPVEDNPLRAAPHTAESLLTEMWDHPYTREQAAYRWAGASGPRCGHRSGASTAPTATATWCARAHRWRRSPSGRLLVAGNGFNPKSPAQYRDSRRSRT